MKLMDEINSKYLDENFLTLGEVSDASGIDEDEIRLLIDSDLAPKPSYRVKQTLEITSPLDDRFESMEELLYFPKSYPSALANRDTDPKEAKRKFIDELGSLLSKHPEKEFAYQNAIVDETRLETELANEWEYYQKGIYGICTLNASPTEIIAKEISVKKLLHFLEENEEDKWKDKIADLTKMVEEYDKVSNLFAPYQRSTSSRGKYVDTPLKKSGLTKKIKTY